MTDHVVMFSGGAGSWATAKRAIAALPIGEHVILLCANTNSEAPDWMPFVDACAADVGGELVMIDNGGRDIWDTFDKARFIGNSRADVCSRVLKREPLRRWLEANHTPSDTVVYLGFDWTEAHRLERARPHWEPWTIAAPLCDPPYLTKHDVLAWLTDCGIPIPDLYTKGFSHNNCAGACVKAGQTEWRRLLNAYPDRYAYNEQREGQFRDTVGKDVAILRDRGGGKTVPLTLKAFRERLTADATLFDDTDFGACSCMDTLDE